MFQISLIIGGVMLILLTVAGGVIYLQNGQIAVLNQDLATERANVQTLNDAVVTQQDTIHTLEALRASDQQDIIDLGEQAARHQLEKEIAVAEFNNYRNRLDAEALRRPAVVSRAATSATKRLFRTFFEATGGAYDPSGNPYIPSRTPITGVPAAGSDTGDNPQVDKALE